MGLFAPILASALIWIMALSGCGTPVPQPEESSKIAMGTLVSQRLYSSSGESHTEEVWEVVDTLENKILSAKLPDTLVWKINNTDESVLDVTEYKELMDYLKEGKKLWEDSEGAFDLALGELINLWNMDKQAVSDAPYLPSVEEIEDAKNKSGFNYLELNQNSIIREKTVKLDLGAVGKGIALDEIKSLLAEKQDITGAVISMGGSILTYGEKPDKSLFHVAIVDPLNPEQSIGYLALSGEHFVSTSGNYERFFEINNTRYHHILNPKSGYPANSGVAGVTILADTGYLSDALSTACFVLGQEKGMALANKYHALALFVLDNGERIMSPELEACFYPTTR